MMEGSEPDGFRWRVTSNILESPLDLFLPQDEDEGEADGDGGGPLRSTRYVNGRTQVVLVALLTQVVVLAIVAMIMGVAVLSMCALLGELLVITAVATALERQMLTFADLTTIMEVVVTVLVTVITIFLAAVSSGAKMTDSDIAAARFV